MKRRELLGALALVLGINILVLAGVAWNRSAVEAELTLSERELPLERYRDPDDNSGVALHLDWHQWQGEWPWLDRAKLAELGFAVERIAASDHAYERHVTARRGYVVLELAGPAWAAHQRKQQEEIDKIAANLAAGKIDAKQAESARWPLDGELAVGSRLFAVDAGPDPARLRQRYPEGSRYLIAAARFGLRAYALSPNVSDKDAASPGFIEEVLVDTLHVPRALQASLLALPSQRRLSVGYRYYDGQQMPTPAYEARVKWGRRLEPWLEAVTLLP
ncbi:MAG: hypothetical protein A2005_06920 [Desulfuromonadales bacterium GWC2_61_20]|nr:MAG: hypothetical protein A2005_06920 [Desulfuromonadales bacterium GWC2_61_20]